MKETQVYLTLLLILITSCKNIEHKQTEITAVKERSIIKLKNESKITVERTELISNTGSSKYTLEEAIIKEKTHSLNLMFTKIDSTYYFDHKLNYSNEITIDSSIKRDARGSFALIIKGIERKFNCDLDNFNCTYYKGLLTPLNKYILTYCGQGYCETFLLDKSTGDKTNLNSPFDSECKIPSISKDGNKLITFSSSFFKKESYIGLYEKDPANNKFEFKAPPSFYTSDWSIKEIIWIDDKTIALEIYDEFGGNKGNELIHKRYLKGTIQ